ncbi:DUF1642 domain-containing protein [Lactococcus cremoris]|uniref:Prophage n=1 Tax=Lactococcus lactis subsp. cremoris TaxID=1359 RepID=A0ABR5EK12_LACLC|nr:DUF1642 domain-containing protein [Lactococcus cremoris]KKW74914.1 Prophage [Lactococcus cremoris]TNU81763.1 DUF1642 domain-containing protein [Lactococcus cremoris]
MDKTFKQKLEILPIKIIQHPVGNTKYYAAVHVKSLIAQADKEFQELKEQHRNQAESILLMLDEIKSLKSQLQQQALPVVPEDVDKAIKYLKKHNNSTLSDLDDILTAKGFGWLDDFQFIDRRFGVGGLNNKLFILSHLAVTGYTVEKPQLFYLKNKIKLEDVGSDLIGYLNLFLTNDGYLTSNINHAKKFTQSEIDSMQTESYEQIEVTE